MGDGPVETHHRSEMKSDPLHKPRLANSPHPGYRLPRKGSLGLARSQPHRLPVTPERA